MSSITSQINQMQNWTAQQEALKSKTEGTNNELDQDMFLKLMLEQLKYQDPLNPMSNQEFLAQQAQFTQLSELQKLNESIEANNGLSQGMDLIGKEVTLIDPNDASKTITGVVEEAIFYQNGCAVVIDGKEYPAGLILSARTPSEGTVPPEGGEGEDSGNTDTEGGNDNTVEKPEGESSALSTLSNVASVSKVAAAASYVGNKISEYFK